MARPFLQRRSPQNHASIQRPTENFKQTKGRKAKKQTIVAGVLSFDVALTESILTFTISSGVDVKPKSSKAVSISPRTDEVEIPSSPSEPSPPSVPAVQSEPRDRNKWSSEHYRAWADAVLRHGIKSWKPRYREKTIMIAESIGRRS